MSAAPESVVAVDVGGSVIKGHLVGPDGQSLRSRTETTPVGDPRGAVAAITAVARDLAATAHTTVGAAGVVVPGCVDAANGRAEFSANIGWRDLPLRDLLQTELRVPVAIDHDVTAAAAAERTLGAAAGLTDWAIVVIGTGIAAVSTSSGRPRRGATGRAGELGHIPVRPGGDPCPCGQRGCLEAYSSARGIAVRYAAAAGRARSSREIADRVDVDPVAARIWSDAVDALADALVTVTMLEDPEAVVIAGGVSQAHDILLAPLRAGLAQRLAWREAPRVVCSPLGADAGWLGAALLGWSLADPARTDAWVRAAQV